MQVELIAYYSKEANEGLPFWYKSTVKGKIIVTCGDSWDDARGRHIQKLTDILAAPEPPLPETVEI